MTPQAAGVSSRDAIARSRSAGGPIKRWLLPVALVVAASVVPAVAVHWVSATAAVVMAVAVAVLVAVTVRDSLPVIVAVSLVPSSFLASTALVPATGYFLPVVTVAGALALCVGRTAWKRPAALRVPRVAVVAPVALYLAAAVVATVTSIDPDTSIRYFVGIVAVLLTAVWFAPWALASRPSQFLLVVLVITVATTSAALAAAVAVVGPFEWFDRWIGLYPVNEITLLGKPTGLLVLRVSGPFLAPGSQSLVLGVGIVGVVALRQTLPGRARSMIVLVLVVLVVALLLTMARNGWLLTAAGVGFVALAQLRRGARDLIAWLTTGVLVLALAGLMLGVLGADDRPDLTSSRERAVPLERPGAGVEGAGSVDDTTEPRLPARGGAELGARVEIWSASLRAIAASPWVGHGPGTNAQAIEPFLLGESRRLAGLTSHNTWLRTWVELGIVGLVALGLFVIGVVASVLTRLERLGTRPESVALAAMFVSLLLAQAFESLLLGGVTLPSLLWALSGGVLAMPADPDRSPVQSRVGVESAAARGAVRRNDPRPRSGGGLGL